MKVSRFVLGTLTMGPLQANLPLDEGAGIIRRAVEIGVNMVDTADMYQTYPYIKRAFRGLGDEVMVASKSYDHSWDGMKKALERARRGVDRDVIDIFLLHQQESAKTLEGHRPAFEFLLEAREKGWVKAVGASTHFVEVVKVAAEMRDVDVLHPIINKTGIGICGGGVKEMMEAAAGAHSNGKGIYAMKVLGGGNLLNDIDESIGWARDLEFIDAMAIGASSAVEVEMDAFLVCGEKVPDSVREAARRREKRLFIEKYCQGCGSCVEACQFGAMSIRDGQACVDRSKCLLCGYCAAKCPDFCIIVI